MATGADQKIEPFIPEELKGLETVYSGTNYPKRDFHRYFEDGRGTAPPGVSKLANGFLGLLQAECVWRSEAWHVREPQGKFPRVIVVAKAVAPPEEVLASGFLWLRRTLRLDFGQVIDPSKTQMVRKGTDYHEITADPFAGYYSPDQLYKSPAPLALRWARIEPFRVGRVDEKHERTIKVPNRSRLILYAELQTAESVAEDWKSARASNRTAVLMDINRSRQELIKIQKELAAFEAKLSEKPPYGRNSQAYDRYMKDRDDDVLRAALDQRAEFALQ